MKVRFTLQARYDLTEIYVYLDQRWPDGSQLIKTRIASAIQRLGAYPLMAQETDEPGVRELAVLRYPYRVYYQLDRDEVWILHVHHTARRPWEGRSDDIRF